MKVLPPNRRRQFRDAKCAARLSRDGWCVGRRRMKVYCTDISANHVDCGEIVYRVREDEFQGGSGAGCSAVILNSYIYDKLKRREINRVLFAATGALLSTVSSGQGESIPCICHAVSIENV